MQTTPETILLVDDEPEVRAVIRDVLELNGYTVLEAGDATEAATVEASVAGPDPPVADGRHDAGPLRARISRGGSRPADRG